MSTPREVRDLEFLAVSLKLHVTWGLQAAIVTAAARNLFHRSGANFMGHPANNFVYSALHALEDRSVVTISEIVKEHLKLFEAPTEIRRRMDLVMHRHARSHPAKIKWREEWMQQFYDDERHHLDVVAALVWDLQRSINERLLQIGGQVHLDTIDVGPPMAFMLHCICRLSMKPEAVPTEGDLFKSLHPFRDRFLDFLVDHPDGQAAGVKEYRDSKRKTRSKPKNAE